MLKLIISITGSLLVANTAFAFKPMAGGFVEQGQVSIGAGVTPSEPQTPLTRHVVAPAAPKTTPSTSMPPPRHTAPPVNSGAEKFLGGLGNKDRFRTASPQWEIRQTDMSTKKALERWCSEAGYNFYWELGRDLPASPFVFEGPLKEALNKVAEGFFESDAPFVVIAQDEDPNNKSIRVVPYNGNRITNKAGSAE